MAVTQQALRFRRTHPAVFALFLALLLVACQGCSQTTDTDPQAKPIPTSREAK